MAMADETKLKRVRDWIRLHGRDLMAMADETKPRHPPGLKFLFFTEMWERFGFYLMLGIFMLYMTRPETERGGLGFDNARAADIYGTFLGLVYFTPFVGGLLADRFLGYRLSITIGGVLLSAGYLLLAVSGMAAFYGGLALIIIGNGFFKPNISTIVGKLYPEGSPLKDAGYNFFYMGINIGAFVCNFVAAIMENQYGWRYAFATAGVGMLIGLVTFWSGQRHLVVAGKKSASGVEARLAPVMLSVVLPAIAVGLLGYLAYSRWGFTVFGSAGTTAFVFSVVPVTAYYLFLLVRAPLNEKAPIKALLVIFAMAVIFWMIYYQNGSALTLWTQDNTDRAAGPALTSTLKATYMHQEVAPDSSYFQNVPPAERPTTETTLISTELFQSINPFFIITLSPLLVWFFARLKRRGKEPSTPGKIAWGMFVTSLSMLPMILAVVLTQDGKVKGSPWWLVWTYGMVTIAELCLSPMGLSLVSKLAPKRIVALMMGGWFVAMAFGSKLAGVLSGLWDRLDHKVFFGIDCICALVGGLAILLMLPWLRRVMKEHAGEG